MFRRGGPRCLLSRGLSRINLHEFRVQQVRDRFFPGGDRAPVARRDAAIFIVVIVIRIGRSIALIQFGRTVAGANGSRFGLIHDFGEREVFCTRSAARTTTAISSRSRFRGAFWLVFIFRRCGFKRFFVAEFFRFRRIAGQRSGFFSALATTTAATTTATATFPPSTVFIAGRFRVPFGLFRREIIEQVVIGRFGNRRARGFHSPGSIVFQIGIKPRFFRLAWFSFGRTFFPLWPRSPFRSISPFGTSRSFRPFRALFRSFS